MKTFKMLLLLGAFSFSTLSFANPSDTFSDLSSISSEIEKILQESHYNLDKDLTVTIFFSISENNKIQCLSVASGNEDVNYFVQKELENRFIMGKNLEEGVIYEVTVDYSEAMLIEHI